MVYQSGKSLAIKGDQCRPGQDAGAVREMGATFDCQPVAVPITVIA
tara:strand:+ start:976 stop:1113 length:138 start_codon:yes stop_codon:yes gene_type:complete